MAYGFASAVGTGLGVFEQQLAFGDPLTRGPLFAWIVTDPGNLVNSQAYDPVDRNIKGQAAEPTIDTLTYASAPN